jgi:GH15 family glucan-1,4-alpha-glucosidase
MSYLPIEDHGIIGDLHTCALVGMDGAIDWLCLPYFDSGSLFASVLDDRRGGFFRIAAASADARRRQMYLPDSNILMTRFLTHDGVGEVVDFMPIHAGGGPKKRADHQVVRLVRGVRGEIPFRLECRPAFDYGRQEARIEATEFGFRFSAGNLAVNLITTLPARIEGESVVAEFLLRGDDQIPVVLAQADDEPPPPKEKVGDISQREFRRTLRFWQNWITRSRYQGRWREMVKRSALTLKLLTFRPTGAIVAAATCSLPERVGGNRNWDYRYTWIRDAAFTVYAFLRVGYTEEATQFISFLEEHCHIESGLRVLYGVDGRHDLPEVELAHLDGYRGSRPVRLGNAAAGQFQLDIAGDLLDAIYLYDKYCEPVSHRLWSQVRGIAEWVCENWMEKDEGIWEVRGGRQDFTFSKMMCWVALDRAFRLSVRESLPGDRDRWLATRDEIYETIMSRGFSRTKNSFVQSLDSDVLDASMLLAPMVKFVAPSDPRMAGTLEAIQRELESDNLVRRYDPRVSPDGVDDEREGTFSMCTFWLAEALARAGRLPAARLTFEKMLGYANHLGLYSEEIGLTGESIGNFPQAFTHLGLISAAVNINRVLDEQRRSPERHSDLEV